MMYASVPESGSMMMPSGLPVCDGGGVGVARRLEGLVPRREAAAVDPRRARRRAVVLQLAEALQVLLGIPGHVAVDLPEHLERADLTRVEGRLARVWIEVPGDVLPP